MKTLTVNEVNITIELVDGLEGYYLCRLADWSKAVANALAAQDNLKLGNMHWCILSEFRKYYDELQCFPSKKVFNERIIYNCQINYEEFMNLFPKGLHQAARISGIALVIRFDTSLTRHVKGTCLDAAKSTAPLIYNVQLI